MTRCPACDGKGERAKDPAKDPTWPMIRCPLCQGSGEVPAEDHA